MQAASMIRWILCKTDLIAACQCSTIVPSCQDVWRYAAAANSQASVSTVTAACSRLHAQQNKTNSHARSLLALSPACLSYICNLYAGECSTLAADLQGAQSSGAELMAQREDLTAQAASLNDQLTDLQAAHETLR